MKGSLYYILIPTLYISWTLAEEVPSPPYIIKQPPTDEILFQVESSKESDKPFFINCEAIGEPAPKYYWIKNGKPFTNQTYNDRISQQTGRGTLFFTKPSDVDIGQYQCFAENQYGTATSNIVFVRKAELNSFKMSQPLTVFSEEGVPFKLTCQPPSGWPKPAVYWAYLYTNGAFKIINSSRITLDPEGNLWFSNLTKSDVSNNFMYICAASSKYQYTYGNRVLLNIVSSEVLASQKQQEPVLQYVTRKNEVTYRRKRAELFCIFGGTPLPQTVWKKDGKLVQSSDRITQGNYGKSLVIKVVDFGDEGVYTCEVSNGVGEAKSHTINLKVIAVPYFIREPERVNATKGETIKFHCSAGGVPEPQIKWIYNGKPIEETPYNPRRIVDINQITIQNLTNNDTGNYGCNATNSLGYVYKDVYVFVLDLSPEIIESPINSVAVDNQNVTLTCKVIGVPKPNVKWFQNGRELTGKRYKIQLNGDLNINKVQFDDQGNYTCYAKNKIGNISANARLYIKARTFITNGPSDIAIQKGASATFRCNAFVDESLKVEILWLKDDHPIDFENERRFIKSTDNSLTIIKTHETDSGTYTCLAITELDKVSAKAQLIIQDVPNAPCMMGVKCQDKYATINWIALGDNRAPIFYYLIQYNTSFIPKEWKDFCRVPSSYMTYNVPLEAWANYTFRIIAVNRIGKSKPSLHSEVCTTSPEVPHKNPENVKGEEDNLNNLVITWTPMPEIEHGARGFKYRVCWKRANEFTFYECTDIHDHTQNKYVVPNQPPYQQYKIKVYAVNQLGDANVAPREVLVYSA